MKKVAVVVGLLLVLVPVVLLGVLFLRYPKVGPAPKLEVTADKSLIARGRYLANHVALCVDCHSTRDWSRFAAPMVKGSEGIGGEAFTEKQGLPGDIYSPNITPVALKSWTDGELLRAITAGVSKDGRPLFPIMPYPYYAHLTPRDARAIIAYVRTFKPRKSTQPIPPRRLNFPVSLIVRTLPAQASPSTPPKSELERGKYLLTLAGCVECHTPARRGQIIASQRYTGGRGFALPTGGTIFSTNLTPDKDTGLGAWTREIFIQRFKSYADRKMAKIIPGKRNTVMPWTMYAGMSKADLGAIFAHLQTLKAVKKKQIPFKP